MILQFPLGRVLKASVEPAPHKLSPPTTSGLVRRSRLIQLIEEKPSARIITIVAPPASGKTCLVAIWATSRQTADSSTIVFWYQIDNTENAAALFNAIRNVVGGRLGIKEKLFDYQASSGADLSSFSAHWFKSLLAGRRRPSVLFVFDDLHRLRLESPITVVIAQIVRSLESNDQIVLVSRLPILPKLLAIAKPRGVVRIDDLKVQDSEYEDFRRDLKRIEPLQREEFEFALLRSGRWMTGLPIIPHIAVPQEETELTLRTAVSRLSEDEQKALKMTAYLQVGSEKDWRQLGGDLVLSALARLGVETGLVTRLNNNDIRKHDVLFEYVVLWTNESISIEEVARLQRATGHLHLERGEVLEGVTALIAGESHGEAASAILHYAGDLIDHAHNSELRKMIHQLPVSYRSLPKFQLWDAYASIPFDLGDAGRRLATIRRQSENELSLADKVVCVTGEIYTALVNMVTDDPLPDLAIYAGRLTKHLDEIPENLRPRLIVGRLIASLLAAADDDQHARDRKEAELLLPTLVPRNQLMLGVCYVFHLVWLGGDIERAKVIHELIEPHARQPDAAHLPVVSWYGSGMALAYRAGEAEQVRSIMADLEKFARLRGIKQLLLTAYWIAGEAEAFAGEIDAADEAIRRYRASVVTFHDHHSLLRGTLEAAVSLTRGNVQKAIALSQEGNAGAEQLGGLQAKRRQAIILSLALALQGDRSTLTFVDYLAKVGKVTQDHVFSLHADLSAAILWRSQKDWDAFALHWRKFTDRSLALGVKGLLGFNRVLCGEMALDAVRAGVARNETARLVHSWRLSPPAGADCLLWPYPIEVDVLGVVRLRRHGQTRDTQAEASPQTIALLGLLAAADGKSLSHADLADVLAPTAEGDVVALRIRQAIRRLRQWIGSEIVVRGPGTYYLNPDFVITDLERLNVSISVISDGGQPPPVRLEACDRALELYKGPLLPALSVPQVVVQRDEIARRFVTATRSFLDELDDVDADHRRARLDLIEEDRRRAAQKEHIRYE